MGACGSGDKKPRPAGGVKIRAKDGAGTGEYPTFKILMIGDPAVGKSSLLLRCAENTFTENFISTIGVDYKEKELQVGSTKAKIQIWDTAGQERFRTITSSYYRGAHGMILAFDLANPQSFQSVGKWMQEVERYADEGVAIVLAGNKSDLGQGSFKVTGSEIDEFRNARGLDYFQVSAKDNTNVEALFKRVTELAMEHWRNNN